MHTYIIKYIVQRNTVLIQLYNTFTPEYSYVYNVQANANTIMQNDIRQIYEEMYQEYIQGENIYSLK